MFLARQLLLHVHLLTVCSSALCCLPEDSDARSSLRTIGRQPGSDTLVQSHLEGVKEPTLGKGEVLGEAWIMNDLKVDKDICV